MAYVIYGRLPCCQADCDNDAEWVVAETNPLNMLFRSGAGLMCDGCSEGACQVGGIRLKMFEFAEAVRREHGRNPSAA